MPSAFAPPTSWISAHAGLIVEAVRCWRSARDEAAPAQRRLYAHLAPREHGLLAPVFDGLLTIVEAATCRRFVAGEGTRPSSDEHRLLDLLDGADPASAIRCPNLASALVAALRSARFMLALVVKPADEAPAIAATRPLFFPDAIAPAQAARIAIREPGIMAGQSAPLPS